MLALLVALAAGINWLGRSRGPATLAALTLATDYAICHTAGAQLVLGLLLFTLAGALGRSAGGELVSFHKDLERYTHLLAAALVRGYRSTPALVLGLSMCAVGTGWAVGDPLLVAALCAGAALASKAVCSRQTRIAKGGLTLLRTIEINVSRASALGMLFSFVLPTAAATAEPLANASTVNLTPLARGREIFETALLAAGNAAAWPVLRGASLLLTLARPSSSGSPTWITRDRQHLLTWRHLLSWSTWCGAKSHHEPRESLKV
jgi:hypothetical protein